jgi:hypothetical protein
VKGGNNKMVIKKKVNFKCDVCGKKYTNPKKADECLYRCARKI